MCSMGATYGFQHNLGLVNSLIPNVIPVNLLAANYFYLFLNQIQIPESYSENFPILAIYH